MGGSLRKEKLLGHLNFFGVASEAHLRPWLARPP